jgi:hypothetical protein
MNIIKARREERDYRIRQIEESIKNVIKSGNELDIKKLILMCCSEWGMSKRAVKEYVDIAKFNLKIEDEPRKEKR